MFFIVTAIIFFIWAVYVTRKRRLSWHTLFSIYTVVLITVDVGDAICDYWLELYDLPTHLLSNADAGEHLGLILSDGVIFPLIGIVFCFYAVRYHRPWLVSLVFAILLGIIEFFYVTFGFMIYHHWYHWTTVVISFFLFRILAIFAERLMSYDPPIPYRIRLFCAVYAIAGWPMALLSGILMRFQYKPILAIDTKNDPLLVILPTILLAAAAAAVIPKTPQKYKLLLFLGLGIISSALALWLHWAGLIQYNQWNDLLMVVICMAPYPVVWLYDKWESGLSGLTHYHL